MHRDCHVAGQLRRTQRGRLWEFPGDHVALVREEGDPPVAGRCAQGARLPVPRGPAPVTSDVAAVFGDLCGHGAVDVNEHAVSATRVPLPVVRKDAAATEQDGRGQGECCPANAHARGARERAGAQERTAPAVRRLLRGILRPCGFVAHVVRLIQRFVRFESRALGAPLQARTPGVRSELTHPVPRHDLCCAAGPLKLDLGT